VKRNIGNDRWTVEELVERTAGYNPPKPTEWESFIDSLPDEE